MKNLIAYHNLNAANFNKMLRCYITFSLGRFFSLYVVDDFGVSCPVIKGSFFLQTNHIDLIEVTLVHIFS